MDKHMQEIEKVMQSAAIDGTLTREAVEMFHGILKENEEIKSDIEKQNKELGEQQTKISDLGSRLSVARTLNEVAAKAEVAMIEREKNITTLELETKHQSKRVEDHKEMFTTVFRNSVLRREVLTAVPGTDGGQYQAPIAGFVSRDTMEEEKK